jgi:hypothetical protein
MLVNKDLKLKKNALLFISVLRSIAATCFEHLFAHHQEAQHIQQLVYFLFGLCRLDASRVGVVNKVLSLFQIKKIPH